MAKGAAHCAAIAREMPPARSFDRVFKVRAKPISDQRRLSDKSDRDKPCGWDKAEKATHKQIRLSVPGIAWNEKLR
jgi:hypothetical protein